MLLPHKDVGGAHSDACLLGGEGGENSGIQQLKARPNVVCTLRQHPLALGNQCYRPRKQHIPSLGAEARNLTTEEGKRLAMLTPSHEQHGAVCLKDLGVPKPLGALERKDGGERIMGGGNAQESQGECGDT